MKTIVWIRQDLRLSDNPALYHACKESDEVVVLFIWSPEEEGDWAAGAAAKWWLHHSLDNFRKRCLEEKLPFVIKKGPIKQALEQTLKNTQASKVVWNRRYEPAGSAVDAKLRSELDVETDTFPGSLLFEPEEIKTQQGSPYQVFTPFWRMCMKKGGIASPLQKPINPKSRATYDSLTVDDLGLLPDIRWDKKLEDHWKIGEEEAQRKFKNFINSGITDYKTLRDFPAEEGVSKMSPHLHFGEVSPRWLWHQIHLKHSGQQAGVKTYLSEIGWREFAYHLLFHFPKTPKEPLHSKFKKMKWSQSQKNLEAWQKGMTGYPIVDAGMRQLWATGWMHNRLRMIVGSFLVKDLLISWTEGAKWFWDTLVDADLASNTLGWQWVGGCGADAAPFFRIFNPVTQSEKFDPEGEYIKTWVPELKNVPVKRIHQPWETPLDLGGVKLGDDYPYPIVDHSAARKKALDAFDQVKEGK